MIISRHNLLNVTKAVKALHFTCTFVSSVTRVPHGNFQSASTVSSSTGAVWRIRITRIIATPKLSMNSGATARGVSTDVGSRHLVDFIKNLQHLPLTQHKI